MRSNLIRSSLRFFTAASVIAGALIATSTASAQEATHYDGFYLRLGAGYGYMTTTESSGGQDLGKIKGPGGALDITIGGSPIPGLAIAGKLFTQWQTKPTVEVGGTSGEADKTVVLAGIGPVVDFFPDSKNGGFHIGGGPLYSSLSAVNYTSTGYAIALFTGYDFHVGGKWSLGPNVQFLYSSSSKDTFTDKTTSIVVFFSALDY
jgi:hypothetical protein